MRLARALVAILVVSSCQAVPAPAVTSTPATTIQPGGALRVALTADPVTIDPWNAADANTLLVTRQVFETLVDYDPTGFLIVPKLAESWSVSPDGRSWTFVLRRGVKFHDGTDLDAGAVVLNLDRARLSSHPLRGGSSPDRFRTYAGLLEGFDDASIITKVEARDGTTVAITTKTPFGPLLADLALPAFAIVSPKSLRDDPVAWATPSSSGAAGTGPFMFRPGAWQREQITLERNPTYWSKDRDGMALPYLDRLIFRAVREESARVAELRAGALDAVRDVTAAVVPTVKADPNLQLITRPASSVSYLGLTAAVKPLDRVEIRRAIAMAIDKTLMATALYVGAARPASQLLPPGMLGYDDSVVEFYRHDTAAAKRLLADAGFQSGFAIELHYPPALRATYPDPKRVAESIAADLAKVGIAVTVRVADAATYRADVRADRPLLWLGESSAESGDPDAFFPDGGAWATDIVRELLRRARNEADPTKRTELYKQVSKLVQQDALRVPLVAADSLVAATRKVRGLAPHPIGLESYAQIWIGR